MGTTECDNQPNTYCAKAYLGILIVAIISSESTIASISDESFLIGFENLRRAVYDMLMFPDVEEGHTLTRSQSVVARVVGGETLIVPIRGKVGDLASIYSLNRTGSLIWRLLECPKSLSELVTAVAKEYEVDTELADRDVRNFVREMTSVGLVDFSSPQAMNGEARPVGRVERASVEM